MRARRGHVVLLILVAIAAAGISFVAMATRLSVATAGRDADQVRTQALWLGRSARAAGVKGKKDVATPEGKATVEVVKGTATVHLGTSIAVVTDDSERYSP